MPAPPRGWPQISSPTCSHPPAKIERPMTKPSPPPRLIVGISGASGVIYGIRALELLRRTGIETHLVVSPAAELTMTYETDVKPKSVRELASVFHPIGDIGAAISSGSFPTMGMLILP